MAEIEIPSSPARAFEAGRGADTALPAIAISEENLLALLGSSALPNDSSPSPSSATAQTTAPVEIALAHLSAAQPPSVQSPALQPPAAQPPVVQPAAIQSSTVQPVTIQPPAVHADAVPSPADQPKAEEADNSATPAPAPQARPEATDGTLALLATIRETRAGLSRKETSRPESIRPKALHPATQDPEALHLEARHPESPRPEAAAAAPSAKVPVAKDDSLPRFLTAAPARSPLSSVLGRLPGGRRTFLMLGTLIVVGGISTGIVMGSRGPAKHGAMVSTSPALSRADAAAFPLRLQLDAQGKGQVNVRWNPQSTLIAQAQQGRLVVTEANQPPRTIPLTLDQLKAGHLAYQQQTERAAFRLEVVDATGAVAEESVLSPSVPRR